MDNSGMDEPAPKIISRKEAQAQGLKRYYTGKPCKHGHIAERSVSDRKCLECNRSNVSRFRENHPESIRETNKKGWSKLSPEYKREKAKRYRTNNRESYLQGMRNHYEQNKAYYKQRRHETLRNLADQYNELSAEEQQRVDAIYAEANELNARDGARSWHVDHIKPLAKGGKHHPDNLQILTAEENLSKGAKYEAEDS